MTVFGWWGLVCSDKSKPCNGVVSLKDPELKCDYLDPLLPLPDAEVEAHFVSGWVEEVSSCLFFLLRWRVTLKVKAFAFSTFSYTIPTSLMNNIFSMPRYFWEASKKAISLHICQVCLPMCSEDGTDAPGGQGNLWTRDSNFSYPVSKRQDISHDSWPDLCWCSHSLFQKNCGYMHVYIYTYMHLWSTILVSSWP